MSQLSQELRTLAAAFAGNSASEVAVGHLKQAGLSDQEARIQVMQMEMEKEATEQLVMQGIDIERAVSMVMAAGIDVKSLTTINLEPEVSAEAELMSKVASYVESLEAEVEDLKLALGNAEIAAAPVHELNMPAAFTKAASSGALTMEDLEELSHINHGTLEKMASAFTPEATWEMGQGSGYARPKTDAILEFCLAQS